MMDLFFDVLLTDARITQFFEGREERIKPALTVYITEMLGGPKGRLIRSENR